MDNNNFNPQQNDFNYDPQQNNMNNTYYNTQQDGYMNNPQQNNQYYNPQQNYYMNNNKQNDNGQTSKICGILSIVLCFVAWFCCIGYVGVPLAIIAIVFGNQTKNNNGGVMTPDGKIGMITGIIGLGVLLLGFGVGLVVGFVMAASGM